MTVKPLNQIWVYLGRLPRRSPVIMRISAELNVEKTVMGKEGPSRQAEIIACTRTRGTKLSRI